MEGSLPAIHFYTTGRGAQTPDPFPVTINYHVPNASSYNWTAGPSPTSEGPNDVTWTEEMPSLRTSVGLSASDPSAANNDSVDAVIVGALLGMFDAALIAAVTEFFHRDA